VTNGGGNGILWDVGEDADRLRASDADRESVAQRLRAAFSEGRLTLHEYDERVRDAYAATTYGELTALLTDLPDVTPLGRSQVMPAASEKPPVPESPGGHTTRWIAGVWSSWFTVACILTVIWVLTGTHGTFWPVWPLGIWGAVLLAQTVTGIAGGAPGKMAQRQAERDARRQARRDERRIDRDGL
jgi:hypothetical protein